MELWRNCLRNGFFPHMSDAALMALFEACRTDDPRLIQGATSEPPPLACLENAPCCGGCALGYAGWRGEGLETVGQVEEYFAHLCYDADQTLGEPVACRYFLNWFDDTPRPEALRALMFELKDEIAKRSLAEDEAALPKD